jgi:hypothetical protein
MFMPDTDFFPSPIPDPNLGSTGQKTPDSGSIQYTGYNTLKPFLNSFLLTGKSMLKTPFLGTREMGNDLFYRTLPLKELVETSMIIFYYIFAIFLDWITILAKNLFSWIWSSSN